MESFKRFNKLSKEFILIEYNLIFNTMIEAEFFQKNIYNLEIKKDLIQKFYKDLLPCANKNYIIDIIEKKRKMN